MTRTLRIAFALGLVWLGIQTAAVAQSIPPNLHARIIQLEDERNLNGDELAKLLKHTSPKVRERAALAIGRIGEKRKEVIDALIDVLEKDGNDQVRAMAAFALGEIEDVRAVPFLLSAALTWRWPAVPDQVQARIIEALGKIASVPGNIEALRQQERDNIVSNAILKLGLAKDLASPDEKLLASLAITALMRLRSPSSIKALIDQLKSKDADIRAQAANALARIRQPIDSAVPVLLETLNDPDADVRANAARALGVSKDARAVEPLIKLFNDKSEQVQANSIRALAAIGDKRAVEPLIGFGESLKNRYFTEERQQAPSSPLPRPIPSQANLLLETATALGMLRDERAVPFLRKLSDDRFWGVLEVAVALGRLDKENFLTDAGRGLTPSVSTWQYTVALLQGIAEADGKKMEERLVQLIGSFERGHLDRRALPETLRTLDKLKFDGLPVILRKQLRDKDVIVRATSAALLANKTGEENLSALLDAWAKEKTEDAIDAKLAILTALSRNKSEKSFEAVKTALNDPDHLVRRHAVNLLKQAGAGDFSDRIGIVQTGHNRLFYQRVVARMNKKVTATIHTAKGVVTMELFPAEAPITVDNFIALARRGYFNRTDVAGYELLGRKNFFVNLTFHRVVPNFVIQGGDPRGDGEGGPGYQIRCEVNTRAYERGAVGMALSGKDTGGSQFFITHSPQPHLDGGYTVFGQVIGGMEVVDRIVRGDLIKRIVITER